ncbi:MAG: proline--tRNA ligase, partial [Thermoleophilia bacterium]
MRLSQLLLPTVKEDPTGAEAISHKLMVRAGLVRQLGAGIYVFLPAGWRVMRNIEALVRAEMEAIGCQEILMPVINPAEIWQESGRWETIDQSLFRFKDRKGADMALAMTHEEVITWLAAREIKSYKQLPQLWYHIQTKERDEARPRSGLLRTREFIMKDSYTFDRDPEGLDEQYQLHVGAYDRIFERCGLRWYRVESDVGMMGGHGAHEYMAPCPAGENDDALAPGYAANLEVASAEPQPVALPAGGAAPEEVPTPGRTSIAAVADQLGLPQGALLKAYPVKVEGRDQLVMVLLRGDHRVNDLKLTNA